MRASLLNLISPFYLLFTKNSLARPRNYVVITGAGEKKYHRYPFPFVSVSEPPTFCHAPQIYVSATGFFNGRLSARLVLCEPSPVDLSRVEDFSVSYRRRRRPRQDAPVRRGCQLPSKSVHAVISEHICSKRLTVAAVIFVAGV